MKLLVEVDDQKIIDAIEAADIGYWARVPKGADTKLMLEGKAEATIEDKEDDDPRTGKTRTYTLTGKKLRKGLKIIAEKYPRHMKDIMDENADATTGDVIIQVALFGEIMYG